jgi:hypothetical protein
VRHRIPIRHHASADNAGDHPSADTEGDHRASYQLRWGRTLSAAGQHRPGRARRARARAVVRRRDDEHSRRRARRGAEGLPNWPIVRYADDFVILVHGTRDDVETLPSVTCTMHQATGRPPDLNPR